MARNVTDLFSLVVPDNLQQDSSVSAISKVIAFDDVGDFVEERERIRRKVELALETEPKVDYSDFAQHVFFDSAVSKFDIARDKILTKYPFNGNSEDKDLFTISCSYYENYIADQWPQYVGYVNFTGSNQYVAVNDPNALLCLGSSSLYVAVSAQPANITPKQTLLEVLSASQGYSLALSGGFVALSLYSGSAGPVTLSASISNVQAIATGAFNVYAAIYDQTAQSASLYFNSTRIASQSVNVGPINFTGDTLLVGNSQFSSGACFTGKIGDVRVMHTASELFHRKNFGRAVTSEDYVKAYYKFNEGITGLSSSDAIVIDYSKSQLHASIINYNGQTRMSGACLYQDDGDPILYSFHPAVVAYTASMEASASIYDAENRNYMLRLIPEQLLLDDQNAQGLLISFALAMARYFDEIKVSVDQFDNLRVTNYDDSNETPDIMLPVLKQYFGWKVTDHFGDANPLEFFFGENVVSSGSLGKSLQEVRNQFWRRILNNLPYLYKTKGKRDNLGAFFNVLGINNNLLNLKEYGYLNANTINDERITKQKPIAFLGFGSGSASQRVVMPNFISGASNPEWTIETVAQLPNAGMPFQYSGLIGTVWQMYDATGLGYSLQWKLNALNSATGSLRFKDDSYGAHSMTPPMAIFDGQFVHLAAVLQAGSASLQVRQVNNGQVTRTIVANSASGPLTSGSYSFLIGAGTGAFAVSNAAGYYGEVRYWNKALSGSELDAHALDFQNIGTNDPRAASTGLRGYWPLNEFKSADSTGSLQILDASQRGNAGTGTSFSPYSNPYKKTLTQYQFLSPSVDLKWTNNKVRIRNATELTPANVGVDTNQVVLEFNLIDALNEDISKIFATMNVFNQAIGSPINKYRDEYEDLEALRRNYFNRLGDSLNFTKFFQLFKWFDRKLATSIKQLLPARVDFIGGEFVVDSHMLERNKYQYKYPVFHTPKDIQDGEVKGIVNLSGSSLQRVISHEAPIRGTYVQTQHEIQRKTTPKFRAREASVVVDGALSPQFISRESEGHERLWRNRDAFFPRKVSGDTLDAHYSSQDGSNYRNAWARRDLAFRTARGFESSRSGSYANGFVMQSLSDDSVHTHGPISSLAMSARYLSGNTLNLSASYVLLSASTISSSIVLNHSIWTDGDVSISTGSFSQAWFNETPGSSSVKYEAVFEFDVTPVGSVFVSDPLSIFYTDTVNSNVQLVNGQYRNLGNGSYRYTNRFPQGAVQFAFDYGSSSVRIVVAAGNVYAINNVRMRFSEPFSQYGQYSFSQFDNQRESKFKRNVNRSLMSSVTSSIYNLYQYNWSKPLPGHVNYSNYSAWNDDTPLNGVNCAAVDSSGNIYFAGTPGPNNLNVSLGSSSFSTATTNIVQLDAQGRYKPLTYSSGTAFGIAIDKNDTIYTCGYSGAFAFVRSSPDKGMTWTDLLLTRSYAAAGGAVFGRETVACGIDYDSSGSLFCALTCQSGSAGGPFYRWQILKALSGAYTQWTSVDAVQTPVGSCVVNDIKVDRSNDYVYACGGINYSTAGAGTPMSGVLRGSINRGATWSELTKSLGTRANVSESFFQSVYVDNSQGRIITTGYDNATRPSLTYTPKGLSQWTTVDNSQLSPSYLSVPALGVAKVTNNNGNVNNQTCIVNVPGFGYCFGVGGFTGFYGNNYNTNFMQTYWTKDLNAPAWALMYKDTSFAYNYMNIYGILYVANVLYVYGNGLQQAGAVVRASKFSPQRAFSTGPSSLSPSYSYVYNEFPNPDPLSFGPLSPLVQYVLNNVSEFPHYGGLFQMRNIVLGTQTKGRIGKTDDSLVQIKYVGSLVQVMWPNQSTLDAPVQGFGELSVGQSPGKLQTAFNFGSLIDVTTYDHMSLYCYLQKQQSGSLDDIVVRIERRPLSNVGFAVDQSVEYDNSGSFTEARYKDILHTKQVDYGDLSLREISYVIDQPLTNVREIRVGARLKNGQADANQNFLIWGRFIKSANET